MIGIIDYQAGNLTSVRYAFEALGAPCTISADPAVLARAERLVFPGVGAAGAAMRHLRDGGLCETLFAALRGGVPFLGICLGTQILFESSEEDGGTPTLGVLPGTVRRFRPRDPRCKVPHMGWNQVRTLRPHPLTRGLPDAAEFYFVHSYYTDPADDGVRIGLTDYAGLDFASMVGRGNLAATQFHPEKSGPAGLRLLENFTRWDGVAEEPPAC